MKTAPAYYQPDPLCHAYPGEPFTKALPCGAKVISSDFDGRVGNSYSASLRFVNCDSCRRWLIGHVVPQDGPRGQMEWGW